MKLDMYLYLVALLLQAVACAYALRMARRGDRRPWLTMAAAFMAMSVFRGVGLASTGPSGQFHITAESFQRFSAVSSVAISLLLFLSLFAIRRLANEGQ